jgi:trk system potassium uptake protein TrkH
VVAGALVAAALATATVSRPVPALTLAAGYLVLTLVELMRRTTLFDELFGHFLRRPGLLVVSSFVVLIVIGTVLLSLPAAAPGGHPISPVDALFTATSASCVTGLIVLDTPHDFSTFGQLVILALIQIGGFNIMVLSTFAAVLLGRSVGLRGEAALGDVLDLHSTAAAYRLVVFIVLATVAVEAVGAAILGLAWFAHGAEPMTAAWNGLFHSISAFCNAGFSLQSDSLFAFQQDPLVLMTFATLIVLGGLGFAVLAGVWWRASGGPRAGLAVQARVVIIATAVLIVVGWVSVMGLEWGHSLDGLGPADRVVNALFQSVTTRTAGFSSVSFGDLQPATALVMMVLMFIGASPGGTGGGIKTTTAVVLLAAIPALAARRAELVLFNRRLPLSTVYRAAAIAAVGFVVVLLTAGLLLATHDAPFEWLLFEAVSAFGTVGLSLGATATLDGFGKFVVAAAMLAGRIGPLTLALLLGQTRETRLSYPRARIMVG